jgi:hypothetical protein
MDLLTRYRSFLDVRRVEDEGMKLETLSFRCFQQRTLQYHAELEREGVEGGAFSKTRWAEPPAPLADPMDEEDRSGVCCDSDCSCENSDDDDGEEAPPAISKKRAPSREFVGKLLELAKRYDAVGRTPGEETVLIDGEMPLYMHGSYLADRLYELYDAQKKDQATWIPYDPAVGLGRAPKRRKDKSATAVDSPL